MYTHDDDDDVASLKQHGLVTVKASGGNIYKAMALAQDMKHRGHANLIQLKTGRVPEKTVASVEIQLSSTPAMLAL